jgi:hypothetical protein
MRIKKKIVVKKARCNIITNIFYVRERKREEKRNCKAVCISESVFISNRGYYEKCSGISRGLADGNETIKETGFSSQ